jgi:S-adenosylmethionine hydrolase
MVTRWISFLSDYGLDDGFVAACHGVLARIAPEARVIDITHLVPAQDVRRAAVVLADTVGHLPPGVHLAVVDPGVGTPRRPVAVQAGERIFVGPDNGLLGWALAAAGGGERVVELAEPAYGLRGSAVTFDGRDVFAPAAAHLARGVPLSELGPPVDPAQLVGLPPPTVRAGRRRFDAEVLTVDRFGNVALAGDAGALSTLEAGLDAPVALELPAGRQPARRGRTFADVSEGELVVYVDSAGHPSIALNAGDAAARLGLKAGDRIAVVVAEAG